MGRKYTKPEPGEWVQPVGRGYRMACCDCSLVHRMDFRIIEGVARNGRKCRKVQFRVYRDNRATAAMRRSKKA